MHINALHACMQRTLKAHVNVCMHACTTAVYDSMHQIPNLYHKKICNFIGHACPQKHTHAYFIIVLHEAINL